MIATVAVPNEKADAVDPIAPGTMVSDERQQMTHGVREEQIQMSKDSRI